MASNEPSQAVSPDETSPKPQEPIEMAEIPGTRQQNASASAEPSSTTAPTKDTPTAGSDARKEEDQPTISPQTATAIPTNTSQAAPEVSPASTTNKAPPLIREMTAPAIGPATDKPSPPVPDPEVEGPVLFITLLLTTGARHPFKLDRKYLRKRGVEVEGDNPVNMSLYKLKELILRDWRDDWDAKPSSPDSIRLISMGKLLSDKSKLSDFGFKENAAPAIVHMSIKPQDLIDEEEANKNVRSGEVNERTPRCRCTIM